ncbi:MAG: LPS export ABC transporter permease LptF [Candidatus Berkiellales bacterium]
MLNLLNRYLLREIFNTFSAVILVILLIAMSNKLVRLLAKAASGDIAPDVLLQVVIFQIPELLAFLLPIALFIAILLCLSHFFADNEIPVMLACGVTWQRLLMLCMSLGMVVMILSGLLTCYFGPKAEHQIKQLLSLDGAMLLMQTITPGRFHSIQQDRLVFYVTDLKSDRSQLKQIFIADQPKGSLSDKANGSVLTAHAGEVTTDPGTGATYIKLINGSRYYGTPGEKNYRILQFQEYQRLLEPSLPVSQHIHRTMPTKMLLDNPTPKNIAELQWRLSVPISALLLAILALPLSRVSVRAGRFGRLFIAVIVCVIYYNLLTISKRWIVAGVLPAYIGLSWVHLLLLTFALFFLAKTSGRWQQWHYALKQRWFPIHG